MCDFPFDLVHMDVWGPFSIPISDGYRYFLTLVDDATRATWLFFMKAKSEVKALIASFYNMVLTQFNVKIKCFRFDNALEFKLSNFYSANDVIHQTSCVYTPQQNSVVERKHQYILSIARALRIQSNLPLSFWGDCVLTVVHLINRLSSPLLQHKTPYELLFGKVPYSHLRVFGCLCFATAIDPKSSKFSPRGRKCVFISYPTMSRVINFLIFCLTLSLSLDM